MYSKNIHLQKAKGTPDSLLIRHKDGANNNVLVIGSAGSGKTYAYVRPNILQGDTSFVTVDINGELYNTTHEALEKKGYKIVQINPAQIGRIIFDFVETQAEIAELCKALLHKESGDSFWETMERLAITAIIGALKQTKESVTIKDVCDLLSSKDYSLFDSLPEDNEFRDLWRTFHATANSTADACLVSLYSELDAMQDLQSDTNTVQDPVDFPDISELFASKIAVFIYIPNFFHDLSSYGRLMAAFVKLLLEACATVDPKCGHIHFYMDDMLPYRISGAEQLLDSLPSSVDVSLIIQCLDQLGDKGLQARIIRHYGVKILMGGGIIDDASLDMISKCITPSIDTKDLRHGLMRKVIMIDDINQEYTLFSF